MSIHSFANKVFLMANTTTPATASPGTPTSPPHAFRLCSVYGYVHVSASSASSLPPLLLVAQGGTYLAAIAAKVAGTTAANNQTAWVFEANPMIDISGTGATDSITLNINGNGGTLTSSCYLTVGIRA